jgi:hypothetical protein
MRPDTDRTRTARRAAGTSTGRGTRHFAHCFQNDPFTLAEQLPPGWPGGAGRQGGSRAASPLGWGPARHEPPQPMAPAAPQPPCMTAPPNREAPGAHQSRPDTDTPHEQDPAVTSVTVATRCPGQGRKGARAGASKGASKGAKPRGIAAEPVPVRHVHDHETDKPMIRTPVAARPRAARPAADGRAVNLRSSAREAMVASAQARTLRAARVRPTKGTP